MCVDAAYQYYWIDINTTLDNYVLPYVFYNELITKRYFAFCLTIASRHENGKILSWSHCSAKLYIFLSYIFDNKEMKQNALRH